MKELNEPHPLDYATPDPVRASVPVYRRVMAYVLWVAALYVAGMSLSSNVSEPARANILTTASSLLILGFLVRYQHVRLWRR